MPRFAILTHDHPFLHWDLLLETGTRCRTWRLLEEPAADRTIPAEPLPDHRLRYLDYEGPVSGNRGEVRRRDAGTYEPLEETAEFVRVELRGDRLNGVAELRANGDDNNRWTFQFRSASPS